MTRFLFAVLIFMSLSQHGANAQAPSVDKSAEQRRMQAELDLTFHASLRSEAMRKAERYRALVAKGFNTSPECAAQKDGFDSSIARLKKTIEKESNQVKLPLGILIPLYKELDEVAGRGIKELSAAGCTST